MDPLVQILKRLTEYDVRYVLIGGVAAVVHGSPVVTRDVDVCAPLDDENRAKIIEALRGLKPRWRFRPDKFIPVDDAEKFRGAKHLYINTDWGDIDILGELPDFCSFEDLAGKTVETDMGGFKCEVLDLDTLIAVKRAAGRDKDKFAVMHLEAIKRIQDEQKHRS